MSISENSCSLDLNLITSLRYYSSVLDILEERLTLFRRGSIVKGVFIVGKV